MLEPAKYYSRTPLKPSQNNIAIRNSIYGASHTRSFLHTAATAKPITPPTTNHTTTLK